MKTAESSLPVSTELQIDSVLNALNSVNLDARAKALAKLERSAGDPQKLMQIIQREAARYRQRTVRGILVSLTAVSVAAAGAYMAPELVALLGISKDVFSGAEADIKAFAWMAVSFLAIVTAGWLSVYVPIRARRSLIVVLEDMSDPRFIGPTLTMLVPDGVTEVKAAITHNRMVRDSITRALKVMLPQARANHRDAITRSQMQTLLALMKQSRKDPALTICILRALQQIGGTSEMGAVQAFARSRHVGVSQAAQETLEYLELREREQKQAQTLLRASDAHTNAAPDVLLRPAMPSSETPSEQLLRPQA